MIKLTVNLSGADVAALRYLAAKRGHTMTNVIRCAIGTEKFFQEEHEKGSQILVEWADGRMSRLVMR